VPVSGVFPAGAIFHLLETGLHVIRLSPYRADLPAPHPIRLGVPAGFLACYFPIWSFDLRSAIRSRDNSSHLCPLNGLYNNAPHGAPTTTGPPPRPWPSADDEPARCQAGSPEGRAATTGSHVHLRPFDELGAQLCPGSIATATPQSFTVASWPAKPTGAGVDPAQQPRSRTAPRPISARFEPVELLRGFTADSLRTPSPLACRTRAVWQYQHVPSLSGLLPPGPAPPGPSCPQLQPGRCDGPAAESSHLRTVIKRLVAHGFHVPHTRATTG